MKTIVFYLLGIPCVLVGGRLAGLDKALIHESSSQPASFVNEKLEPSLDATSDANTDSPAVQVDATRDSVLAVVVPEKQTEGRAKVTSIIKMVVERGQQVSAGEVIAQLDTRELESQIRQQILHIESLQILVSDDRSASEVLSQRIDRYRPLVKDRIMSAEEFQKTERELDATLAKIKNGEKEIEKVREELRKLEQSRDKYVITAPFSGIVTSVAYQADQLVQEGDVILEIESTTKQVRALVPTDMATQLQTLSFSVDAGRGERIELQVSEITGQGTTDGYQDVTFNFENGERFFSDQPVAVLVDTPGSRVRPEVVTDEQLAAR